MSRDGETAAPQALPLNIPFAFARKFGVALLGAEDGHLAVAMRQGADPRVLIEMRRFLARPFDIRFTPAD